MLSKFQFLKNIFINKFGNFNLCFNFLSKYFVSHIGRVGYRECRKFALMKGSKNSLQ